MGAPKPPASVPLEPLRLAVRRAVERSSAVQVAREIGLSPPAVRSFMRGAVPRESTLRMLTEWSVRNSAVEGTVSADTIRAALALLLDSFSPDERQPAERELRAFLADLYQKRVGKIPTWLRPQD